MKIILNGVIRTFDEKELEAVLNKYLKTKSVSMKKKSENVQNITVQNHSIFFHYVHDFFVIHNVTKIEINEHEKIIKIFSKNHFYVMKIYG